MKIKRIVALDGRSAKVLHKVLHARIKQKYACATEKMKEDIRGEGGEKKGDMEHCLGKDQVGRKKKLK
jgi:hypothetical protein